MSDNERQNLKIQIDELKSRVDSLEALSVSSHNIFNQIVNLLIKLEDDIKTLTERIEILRDYLGQGFESHLDDLLEYLSYQEREKLKKS